jgi:hypothetical protein
VSLTKLQPVLLERARQDGQPLDPEQFDDAAVLLRAEILVESGWSGRDSIARARAELAASRRTVPPTGDRVHCPACGTAKKAIPRAAFPGLLWPVCGHRPIVLAQPAAMGWSDVGGRRRGAA